MMRRSRITPFALAAALAAAALGLAGRESSAAPRAARETPPVPRTNEVGDAYERARLLTGDARMAALEQAHQSVEQVLHGDLEPDARAKARFLAGKIQYE